MPRRACLLLLLALPPVIVTAVAATGTADTTIVSKERLETPGEPGTTSTLTRYYKGNKARIDKEPGPPSTRSTETSARSTASSRST
jgi:hypothetical protein